MIRAAVTGAASAVAGELINLVVNHLSVELMWAYEPVRENMW